MRYFQAQELGRLPPLLPLLVIVFGVAARFIWFPFHPNLWEDEIIATTHAVQPLGRLLINVARHDIHPPLYFVQLHYWALASRADWWFVLNSVLWSLAALASLWVVVRRQTGDAQLAFATAAIFAVMPTSLDMAFAVRMYAMLSLLMIWGFFAVERVFAGQSTSWRWPLAIINLVLIYTHAAGFLAVFFNGLYALYLLLSRRAPTRDARDWFLIFGSATLFAVPMIASDTLHHTDLEAAMGPATLVSWPAVSTVGTNPAGGAGWLIVGMFIFLALACFGLFYGKTRGLVACYIVAPLLLAIVVGFAVKPVFKADFFSTILSPFIAIVLARLILEAFDKPSARLTAFGGAALALALMSASRASVDTKSSNFVAPASIIRAEARPGDAVFTPQLSMFWGMAWNLVGPKWGSPLAIAPKTNFLWQNVYRLLGSSLVARLGLEPTSQSLHAGKLTLYVGRETLSAARRSKRLWILTFARPDRPPEAVSPIQGGLKQRAIWYFGFSRGLSLALYEPAAGAISRKP